MALSAVVALFAHLPACAFTHPPTHSHPGVTTPCLNAQHTAGQSKEGFSVFGVLNKCVSAPGKRLLRLWFVRPIVNLSVLNDRLDAIDFFVARPDAIKALRWAESAGGRVGGWGLWGIDASAGCLG